MFQASLHIDISRFEGKLFKLIAANIRIGIVHEHGYQGTKGITDVTLKKFPITVRFRTRMNRESFRQNLMSLLHPNITSKMGLNHKLVIKRMIPPQSRAVKPVRINSSTRLN